MTMIAVAAITMLAAVACSSGGASTATGGASATSGLPTLQVTSTDVTVQANGTGGTTSGTRITDPCGLFDVAHVDPGLGEVRNAFECDATSAVAYVVSPEGRDLTLFLHWTGTRWEQADPAAYCATAASIPPGTYGEDNQTARIYMEECRNP